MNVFLTLRFHCFYFIYGYNYKYMRENIGYSIVCNRKLKWSESCSQLCPTFCNLMDYTVYGILQAGILEWVAVPFSRESSQPRDWTQISHIAGGFFTSWATREAPKCMVSYTFFVKELNQERKKLKYKPKFKGYLLDNTFQKCHSDNVN